MCGFSTLSFISSPLNRFKLQLSNLRQILGLFQSGIRNILCCGQTNYILIGSNEYSSTTNQKSKFNILQFFSIFGLKILSKRKKQRFPHYLKKRRESFLFAFVKKIERSCYCCCCCCCCCDGCGRSSKVKRN
jgi:hypothetical protein